MKKLSKLFREGERKESLSLSLSLSLSVAAFIFTFSPFHHWVGLEVIKEAVGGGEGGWL